MLPWHGLGGKDEPKGGCLQLEPHTLCLPLPWHSQAISEVLHERVQAGKGEDRQDSKGQLKGEGGERGAQPPGWGVEGQVMPPPALTRMLCRTLSRSFMPVRWLTSLKAATKMVGRIAKERVKSTRAKRDQRSCRKPWGHGETCALASHRAWGTRPGRPPKTLAWRNVVTIVPSPVPGRRAGRCSAAGPR